MIGPNYKPPMKPWIRDGVIGVSKAYWEFLPRAEVTADELTTIEQALCGQSICPPNFYFRDTPELRRLLRVEMPT